MGKGGYLGGSTVIRGVSGWVGRGSVTSQPASKQKRPSQPSKPRKQKSKQGKASKRPNKNGNGLTIREKIERANKKVESLLAEIAQTRRRLVTLQRDLVKARETVEEMRNLPRKSAIGIALHEAEKAAQAQ